MNIVTFVSPTGDIIKFHIYDYASEWNEVGGIYMFCRSILLNGRIIWIPVYVGKTNNFKNRLPNHEKREKAVQLGAVKVHAVVEESEYRRSLLEFQLIQRFDPPLNKQLRPLPSNPELSPVPQAYSIPMGLGMSLIPKTHQGPIGLGMNLVPQTHQHPAHIGMSLASKIHQEPISLGMSLLPQTHQNPKGPGLLGSL
jgi:hypothetical protein